MKLIAILDADAASFSLRDETGGNANFETPWHRAVLRLEDESGAVLRSVEAFVDGRLDVRTGEDGGHDEGGKQPAEDAFPYKQVDGPGVINDYDRHVLDTPVFGPSDPEPSDGEAEAPQAEVAADVHAQREAPVDDPAGDAPVDRAAAGDGEAHAEDAAGVDDGRPAVTYEDYGTAFDPNAPEHERTGRDLAPNADKLGDSGPEGAQGREENPAVEQAPDMPTSAVAEADPVEQPALPDEKPSETPLAPVGNVSAPDTEQGEVGEQMAGQGFAAFSQHVTEIQK